MAWWWPDLISLSIIQLCHIWSQLKEDPLDYLGIERNENHNTLYRNTGNSPSLFGNTIIFDWCMPIHIFKILEMGWLTMYLYKTIKVEWYPGTDKSMDLHLFVALPNASLTMKDYQSMGQVWPLTSGDISIETPWPHDKNHCLRGTSKLQWCVSLSYLSKQFSKTDFIWFIVAFLIMECYKFCLCFSIKGVWNVTLSLKGAWRNYYFKTCVFPEFIMISLRLTNALDLKIDFEIS